MWAVLGTAPLLELVDDRMIELEAQIVNQPMLIAFPDDPVCCVCEGRDMGDWPATWAHRIVLDTMIGTYLLCDFHDHYYREHLGGHGYDRFMIRTW